MRLTLEDPVPGCDRCGGHDVIVVHGGKSHLALLRSLPSRHWHSATEAWHVPYVLENWQMLADAGVVPKGLPKPENSGYVVDRPYGSAFLLLKTLASPDDIQRCKKIPESRTFSPKDEGWLVKPTRANVEYLQKAFPQAQWTAAAQKAKDHFRDTPRPAKVQDPAPEPSASPRRQARGMATELPADFQFTKPPFQHQVEAFLRGRGKTAFAEFMEMGTGKTFVDIHDTIDWVRQGKINGWLIICPNSVKSNWQEELAQFLPESVDRDVFVWEAKTRHKAQPWVLKTSTAFRCLIMNVEAFSSKTGAAIAELFLAKHTCKMTVDESSRIKSHSAARTRKIMSLGKKAIVRRILTGTPVTQSPLDLYTQFRFLDPAILGHSTFWGFRNTYAVMGGFEGRQVVGFVNLDQLVKKIEPYSFRVLKADCLDLPPKVYQKLTVTLSDEQKRLYTQMKDEMVAELGGQKVTVQHAIVQLQLLQRIIGGFLPIRDLVGHPDDPQVETRLERIPGPNPKLEELLDIAAETDKLIIWARFRAEISLIASELRRLYGDNAVREFHGDITTDARTEARRSFQEHTSGVRFLVAQPQAGGIGLTLTAASTVVYYSNDFSLETRQQSEDRAHRIGQTKKVTYIDLVAKGTLDTRLLAALRSKKSMADLITGDPSLQWL